MDRDKRFVWSVILVAFVLSILGMAHNAHAQEPVETLFNYGCYEPLETGYRFHYGYWSDGVDTYTVTDGAVVTTAAGWHDDVGTFDGDAAALVIFANDTQSQEMLFNVATLATCEPVVIPTPPPDVQLNTTSDTCPAWAVDGATGGKVCLWGLPRVGEWQ